MASNIQTGYFRTDFLNPTPILRDLRFVQQTTPLRVYPQFYQGPTTQPMTTLPQVRATAAPMPLSQGYRTVYHQPFCGFYPSQATPYYTGQSQTFNSFYSYLSSYASGGASYYGQSAPQVYYPQGGSSNSYQGTYYQSSKPATGSYYGQPGQVIYPQGYPSYYSSSYPQQSTAPVAKPVTSPANNVNQPPVQVVTKPVTPPPVVIPSNSNNTTVPPKPTLPIVLSPNNGSATFDPLKDSSTGQAGGKFGKAQIKHGATINDFFPNWPPKNPRENAAYFGVACEEYKKYCNVTSLGNCTEDLMGFGGDVAHDLLGIQQKNVFILSEYLDDQSKLPTLANYKAMIKASIDYANAHGMAVIQLSGHGTQLPINYQPIQDRINPKEIANIPISSYENDSKVECQFLLDGGFYLDREFLAALSHLNENAFLLVMFDNCHDGFDFPRTIFGDGTIKDESVLNGVIKGCVTFLGTSKEDQTSSDGAPNLEFPAGAGAGTAAFADTIMRLSAQKGIDKISFRELATTAEKKLPQGQTLCVSSSYVFDPDEFVPLTPEGAKAFMERHKTAAAV